MAQGICHLLNPNCSPKLLFRTLPGVYRSVVEHSPSMGQALCLISSLGAGKQGGLLHGRPDSESMKHSNKTQFRNQMCRQVWVAHVDVIPLKYQETHTQTYICTHKRHYSEQHNLILHRILTSTKNPIFKPSAVWKQNLQGQKSLLWVWGSREEMNA